MFTNKEKLKTNKTNTKTIPNRNDSYSLISYVLTPLHLEEAEVLQTVVLNYFIIIRCY